MHIKTRTHPKEGQFVGKVVAVTGSARGLGKNIARAFGREGAVVAICDINEKSGGTTSSELRQEGITAEFFPVDLSQRGAPQLMVEQIVQRHGELNLLINNARSGRRTTLWEEDEDSWEQGISVTLRGAFFASQKAISVMSQAGGGVIVNLGSVAGVLALPESPIYHIAKAGVIQMTRYLAAYSGSHGVRVNCVLPGFIVQDENRARYQKDDNRRYREIAEFCHPVGHVGTSGDVVNAILYLCSPEAAFISGQVLVVDGASTTQEQYALVARFEDQMH